MTRIRRSPVAMARTRALRRRRSTPADDLGRVVATTSQPGTQGPTALSDAEPYDALVLGAGVSGLTTAAVLADRGLKVCVVDEYPEPGGNHLSWNVGPYTFDIGAIFFWHDNPMFQIFPQMMELCVPARYTTEKIVPSGRVVTYPFDFKRELYDRPVSYRLSVFTQIMRRKLHAPKLAGSARDFIAYYIGDTLLHDTGLNTYFRRFYGLPPEAVSGEFAHMRMRWIADNAGLRAQFMRLARRRRDPPGSDPALALARPRDGFATLYRAATAQLGARGVRFLLGAPLARADITGHRFELSAGGSIVSGARLVSTIPLARTLSLFGLDETGAPPSIGMITLFCAFRGNRNFDSLILYNFQHDGTWKRLTMHSDYYGRYEDWQYFSVEITQGLTGTATEPLFEDVRANVRRAGLFEGDFRLVGSARTEFAYPVYDRTAAAKRDESIRKLSDLGVELLGRQGSFEYIASSKTGIEDVFRKLRP